MEETFKDRLLRERDDLRIKTEKLRGFIDTTAYYQLAMVEQKDLRIQLAYMEGYLNTLNARLGRLQKHS